MRKCPVCSIPLKELLLENEIVDKCPECNGIYFDKGELESISSIVEIYQDTFLDEREIDTISSEEVKRRLFCPVDGDVLSKHEVAGITLDICNKCGGIWVDDGEISALKLAEKHIKKNISLYIRLGE